MSDRPHGKHVSIDASNPQAVAICDYSGFVHMHKNLVPQMEWRGDELAWTGFLVGRDYVDVPNEQARPPILPPDPIPVSDARTQQPTIVTWTIGNNVPWNLVAVDRWPNWNGAFDGVIADPEAQRLAELEVGYFLSGSSFEGTGQGNDRLALLQSTHWGS